MCVPPRVQANATPAGTAGDVGPYLEVSAPPGGRRRGPRWGQHPEPGKPGLGRVGHFPVVLGGRVKGCGDLRPRPCPCSGGALELARCGEGLPLQQALALEAAGQPRGRSWWDGARAMPAAWRGCERRPWLNSKHGFSENQGSPPQSPQGGSLGELRRCGQVQRATLSP